MHGQDYIRHPRSKVELGEVNALNGSSRLFFSPEIPLSLCSTLLPACFFCEERVENEPT